MQVRVLESYWDEEKKKYFHAGDYEHVEKQRFDKLSKAKIVEAVKETAEKTGQTTKAPGKTENE